MFDDVTYELDGTTCQEVTIEAVFSSGGSCYVLRVSRMGDRSGTVELYKFDALADRNICAEAPDFVGLQGFDVLPDFRQDYDLALSDGSVITHRAGSSKLNFQNMECELMDLSDLKVIIGADYAPICIMRRQVELGSVIRHRLAVVAYLRNTDEQHSFQGRDEPSPQVSTGEAIIKMSVAMYA
jgi:hypothetical protein